MVERNRFITLLGAIVVLLLVSPLVREIQPLDSTMARLAVSVGFTVLLISAVLAVSRSRWETIASVAVAVPLFMLQPLSVLIQSAVVDTLDYLFGTAFLALVVVIITRYLFETRRVTFNTICAAICVYLLLGVLWALVFSAVEIAQPGSFSLPSGVDAEGMRFGGEQSADSLYFSFVTLTTLGFGDISPARPVAKILVCIEAVIGQLFLAILVARLVGLHITQSTRRD